AENSGLEGSVVVNKVRDLKAGEGLNAATGEYGDLIKDGVIDPTMVTRSALQNAASIAKNILVTEAVIAEPPEKEPAGMPGGGMPGMGGMTSPPRRGAILRLNRRVTSEGPGSRRALRVLRRGSRRRGRRRGSPRAPRSGPPRRPRSRAGSSPAAAAPRSAGRR